MLKYIFLSLLLSSCSTTSFKEFFGSSDTEDRNEKLMEDFKVDDDVLNKFKESKSTVQKTSIKKKTTTPRLKEIRPVSKTKITLKPLKKKKKDSHKKNLVKKVKNPGKAIQKIVSAKKIVTEEK